MQEKSKKTVMTVMSSGGSIVLSKMLADKFISVSEEPGIKDDVKEALLKAVFTAVAASVASILVRNFIR